jgi:formylglycine-generating enzyme required for sulfatase activity
VAIPSAAALALAFWLLSPHVRFWWLFEPLGANPQGFAEYRHRATGVVFVRVPGGTFLMGAQGDDPDGPNHAPEARSDSGPVHEVTLSPFLIAKRKLTRGEWRALMRHELLTSAPGHRPPKGPLPDDSSVASLSWSAVGEFCARYKGPRGERVLRLPTEAQWEYACRGPAGGAGAGNDAAFLPHPEASNGFGLCDLYLITWEWCEDVYDARFYGSRDATGSDPLCDWGSHERVIRGGGWRCTSYNAHAAWRGRADPERPVIGFGFRPAYWPLP